MRSGIFIYSSKKNRTCPHTFFFLSFCLSIYPVPYGLINPLQFLFSFAHMKISIEKKEGL